MTNKKYVLTDETRNTDNDVVCHRIKAVRDFGLIKAGELGGFIETEENLSHDGDCWVGGNAHVSGNAQVANNARVYGNAHVSGNARITDNARVFGDALVHDNAHICGRALVCGNAEASDNAYVSNSAKISGNAHVSGNAKIFSNSKVFADAWVTGDAWVYGNSNVSNYFIGGYARIINGLVDIDHPFIVISNVGNNSTNVFTFYYSHVGDILVSSIASRYCTKIDGFNYWCEHESIKVSEHQAAVVKRCGVELLEAQVKR